MNKSELPELSNEITRWHLVREGFASIRYGVKSLVTRDYSDRNIAEMLMAQTWHEFNEAKITFVEKALGYISVPAVPLAAMKLLLMMFGPKKQLK